VQALGFQSPGAVLVWRSAAELSQLTEQSAMNRGVAAAAHRMHDSNFPSPADSALAGLDALALHLS
jgi:hypothetical protein